MQELRYRKELLHGSLIASQHHKQVVANGAVVLTFREIYPLVTNGFSHPYHLGESIFIFRGTKSNFSFLFQFSINIISANRIAPDGTPRSAASHLLLFCLHMSHKKMPGRMFSSY